MGTPKEIKLDLMGFNARVKKLAALVPAEGRDAMQAEARLLVEALIKKTKAKATDEKLRRRVMVNLKRIAQMDAGANKAEIPRPLFYAAWRRKLRLSADRKELVARGAFKRFADEQVKHKGFMAAGFLGSGNPLGAKRGVPKFVTRHRPQGTTEIRRQGGRFTITITNLVSYAQKNPIVQRILAAVIEGRKKQIDGLIRRIKRGQKYQFAKP